ncbi:TPA: AAA family ATPase [Vibrio parahaemolyticus]|uniref:KAP family P-loop NTPase fold protein n=5 Tax=Vibrio parahaemolyticus TaxID=670 RepID=UPI0028F6D7C6|nr:P-loop NTPase fold protein [Vibrio parahaemolyticus]HCG6122184.1 AAA family ATPase [Vibrio parahaemolyticus]HCG6988585.1 AAA family ATPase [Vibrio parahaemolyticus]
MNKYYNDTPIENADGDLYGVAPFAESIATSIQNIKNPVGTALALNGPWGSGKSSVVNMIRASLEQRKDANLVVTDFKCWWFRGEEALALAFLQNLHTTLKSGLGDKIKGLIPNLSKNLLQAGSVVGQTVAVASGQGWLKTAISGSSNYIEKTFFSDTETVEKSFQKLADILDKQEKRFLVVIDDIDWLTPDEALATFRLIKSIGHLPNVMYLLVFDRELAEKVVSERYPSEGPHFLEKIIQAGFEVPLPVQTDLNDVILSSIGDVCGGLDGDEQLRRFMNVFYDVVVPYMPTPRHVVRFRNAISVTWPAIADEVSLADFVALETIRLYEPTLFNRLRKSKSKVCGTNDNRQNENGIEEYLKDIPDVRHDLVTVALQRLFPKLESMGYGADWEPVWKSEKRVCVDKHFDTYFRLSLSTDDISAKDIELFIQQSGNREFVQTTMLNASEQKRKNGKSMVPVFLDELNVFASKIPKSNVQVLVSALFEIFEQINLQCDDDRGYMSLGDTRLRYHWLIRRLTEGRFTLEEKNELFAEALESASMEWTVDFARSAASSLDERKDWEESKWLVSADRLPLIIDIALAKVREAAENMSLLSSKDLISLLYSWGRLMNDDFSQVQKWTDKLLLDDKSTIILANALIGESWSMGLGGFGALGDRVSMASKTVRLSENNDIINAESFRARLEDIRSQPDVSAEVSEFIDGFFVAWTNTRD